MSLCRGEDSEDGKGQQWWTAEGDSRGLNGVSLRRGADNECSKGQRWWTERGEYRMGNAERGKKDPIGLTGKRINGTTAPKDMAQPEYTVIISPADGSTVKVVTILRSLL